MVFSTIGAQDAAQRKHTEVRNGTINVAIIFSLY